VVDYLHDNGNVSKCTIIGITDWGLLRARCLDDNTEIHLQPDGNSFDMVKGLIKTKN
jgi:biotin--protein ligase